MTLQFTKTKKKYCAYERDVFLVPVRAFCEDWCKKYYDDWGDATIYIAIINNVGAISTWNVYKNAYS